MRKEVHFVVNFILVKENKVLLERKAGDGWKLPGGHINEYETPIDAVKREAKEELGINLEVEMGDILFNVGAKAYSLPTPINSFYHEVSKDGHSDKPHINIGFVYITRTINEIIPQEGQQVKWFTKNEIESTDIFLPVKKIALLGLEK